MDGWRFQLEDAGPWGTTAQSGQVELRKHVRVQRASYCWAWHSFSDLGQEPVGKDSTPSPCHPGNRAGPGS